MNESKDNSEVEQLSLSLSNINSEGMLNFSLSKYPKLIKLDLYDNKIGDLGCKYLSRVSFNRIESIQLTKNQIGNAGILHISKAKWKSPNALSLYLDDNKINQSGLRLFIRFNFSNINSISITNNKLTVEQIQYLMLLNVRRIQNLYVYGGLQITDSLGKQLEKRFRKFNLFV